MIASIILILLINTIVTIATAIKPLKRKLANFLLNKARKNNVKAFDTQMSSYVNDDDVANS